MNAERARAARALGQSLWYDNISRALLRSGELARLIQGEIITGITTNPTIFQNAVASGAYADDIARWARAGEDARRIYHRLTMEDVAAAADLLLPVHERTRGRDGYVSLELPPALAQDAAGSVAAGVKLADELGRPNVMIKVPGTPAGVSAFRELTERGYHINVTLLFSLDQYEAVAQAYLAALHARQRAGKPVDSIASVASFFVSRVDGKVDAALERRAQQGGAGDSPAILALRGQAGIANCKVVYRRFRELFGAGFSGLRERGAAAQRVLWASTSTKNPAYPDTLYADALLGADTVNTLPPAALEAFLDHGDVSRGATVEQEGKAASDLLSRLAELGIDLAEICEELQREGVAAFAKSFDGLIDSVDQEARRLTLSS